MTIEELRTRGFESEFIFQASRSSGPGGQNVNKVSSKIELRFNLLKTIILTNDEKDLIFRKLKNKINSEGELLIISQDERSQLLNKLNATDKFYILISKALTIPKKRRSTRPTIASKVKRLENKKNRGKIKKLRKDAGELL